MKAPIYGSLRVLVGVSVGGSGAQGRNRKNPFLLGSSIVWRNFGVVNQRAGQPLQHTDHRRMGGSDAWRSRAISKAQNRNPVYSRFFSLRNSAHPEVAS